jgi:hypothetical protein
MPRPPRLAVENIGPIRAADVTFGDLTIIVGPQATGKSLFLQTLKLVLDRDQIHETFARNGMSFGGSEAAFFDGYYGRGVAASLTDASSVVFNGRQIPPADLTRFNKAKRRHQRLFYIPAQRVMSLPNGATRNFGAFNYGDPYVLRAFSDTVHDLVQNEFGAKGELFPADKRLNATLRQPIAQHLFGAASLVVDDQEFTKTLGLRVEGQSKPLGFLSWSAGQREFTPMLMGLYWLYAVSDAKRKSGQDANDTVDWVVLEEPEMGLHPEGIQAVLLLALELLRRGYRVVVSTHSPVVLEMVWALQQFRKLRADESSVRRLFNLKSTPFAKELAAAALVKEYRVCFFDRNGTSRDISNLDPSAEQTEESEWGGLVGFASAVNAEITRAVNHAEVGERRARKTSH